MRERIGENHAEMAEHYPPFIRLSIRSTMRCGTVGCAKRPKMPAFIFGGNRSLDSMNASNRMRWQHDGIEFGFTQQYFDKITGAQSPPGISPHLCVQCVPALINIAHRRCARQLARNVDKGLTQRQANLKT